jgi:hypothetical protein
LLKQYLEERGIFCHMIAVMLKATLRPLGQMVLMVEQMLLVYDKRELVKGRAAVEDLEEVVQVRVVALQTRCPLCALAAAGSGMASRTACAPLL